MRSASSAAMGPTRSAFFRTQPASNFGAGLGEAEVRHLMREEFALEADDVVCAGPNSVCACRPQRSRRCEFSWGEETQGAASVPPTNELHIPISLT